MHSTNKDFRTLAAHRFVVNGTRPRNEWEESVAWTAYEIKKRDCPGDVIEEAASDMSRLIHEDYNLILAPDPNDRARHENKP